MNLSQRLARSVFGKFGPRRTSHRPDTQDVILTEAEPYVGKDHWLSIDVCETTRDDQACRKFQERGQRLARQDRWDLLASEMHEADQARRKTPGGLPVADLLAFGARADVVNAVEHALADGHRDLHAALSDGINDLEIMLSEEDDHPMLTLVVALAHIDIGWLWRGLGDKGDSNDPALKQCAAHFDRASVLLGACDGLELSSPALAAARCSLFAGKAERSIRIADDYEDLIDLDPSNYRAMRALGNHLLPRWFGSYRELELEARRTAARTEDMWGAGAYTWVQFDAVASDDVACALLDVDFFIDGLHDIIARRPDQEMANLLTSFCAVAVRGGYGESPESDANRNAIAECAQWLVRDHLREVHPLIWAHAADGYDNAKRVTSVRRFTAMGRRTAIETLEDLFYDDRTRGMKLVFTPDGLVREHA